MDKKLTISLNQTVIEKAKEYAKSNDTSLSKMIEAYFNTLTNEKKSTSPIEITPFVESLCGVIKLPLDFDYKSAKASYLSDKYK